MQGHSKLHQVTKYVDVKHCEDITTTSLKPVTKTSCNDHLENVPRQKANEGCMDRPVEGRVKTSRDIYRFQLCKEDMERKTMEEIQVFYSLFPYNEWKKNLLTSRLEMFAIAFQVSAHGG
jgi:hypothetical protein